MPRQIFTGTQKRPQRIVIYGPEGIGKSTFASLFPKPLFIDTESGTDHLDVARFEEPETWEELAAEIEDFRSDHQGFETLVIDTADGAALLCEQYVLERDRMKSLSDYGYGAGYEKLRQEWQKMLISLDGLITGPSPANVVIVAHSQLRKFEVPEESGSFDKYELKMDKRLAAATKEWADAVLFLNFRTIVSKNAEGHVKASGKERTLYTEHNAVWDAKNRWGLPEEVRLADAWPLIESHVSGFEATKKQSPIPSGTPVSSGFEPPAPAPEPEKPAKKSAKNAKSKRIAEKPATPTAPEGTDPRLADLMAKSGISEEQIRRAMSEKGYRTFECALPDYPTELVDWMVSEPVWPGLLAYVRDMEAIPFN